MFKAATFFTVMFYSLDRF